MKKIKNKLKNKKISETSAKKEKKFTNIKNYFSHILDKASNLLKMLNKKDKKISLLTIFTIVLLFSSIYCVSIGIKSFFVKYESKEMKFSGDERKFIQVSDGTFIVEEMIVEVGDRLPDISKYFSEDTEIADDAKILYYQNDEILSLDNFTYEEEGVLYVKNIGYLTAVITNGEEYEVEFIIRDTIPPVVTLKDVTINKDDILDLKSFVNTYSDNSLNEMYSISFKNEVDYTEVGSYEVELSICDFSENCTDLVGNLNVVEINETPNSGNKDNNNDNNNENNGGGNNQTPEEKPTPDPSKPETKPTPDPVKPQPTEEELKLEAAKKHMSTLSQLFKANNQNTNSVREEYKNIMSEINPDVTLDSTLSDIAQLRIVEIAEYQNGTALKDQNGNTNKINNHIRYNGDVFSKFIEDYDKVYNTKYYSSSKAYGEIYLNGYKSIFTIYDAFYEKGGWLGSEAHKEIIMNSAYKKMGVAKYRSKDGMFHYLILFSS